MGYNACKKGSQVATKNGDQTHYIVGGPLKVHNTEDGGKLENQENREGASEFAPAETIYTKHLILPLFLSVIFVNQNHSS